MRTILLVEDDLDLRDLLNMTLTARGYLVLLASNGCEALGHLGQSAVDLILTDFNMPDMDGGTLLKAVKALGSTIPMIMISACQVSNEYCDEFISKPFDLNQLLIAIDEFLALDSQAYSA